MQTLLDYNASPLVPEFSGRTPLFLAVKRNDVAILDVLASVIPAGVVAELANKADTSGITPMSMCRAKCEPTRYIDEFTLKNVHFQYMYLQYIYCTRICRMDVFKLVTKADTSGITPVSICRAKCEPTRVQCTALIHPVYRSIHPQKW